MAFMPVPQVRPMHISLLDSTWPSPIDVAGDEVLFPRAHKRDRQPPMLGGCVLCEELTRTGPAAACAVRAPKRFVVSRRVGTVRSTRTPRRADAVSHGDVITHVEE